MLTHENVLCVFTYILIIYSVLKVSHNSESEFISGRALTQSYARKPYRQITNSAINRIAALRNTSSEKQNRSWGLYILGLLPPPSVWERFIWFIPCLLPCVFALGTSQRLSERWIGCFTHELVIKCMLWIFCVYSVLWYSLQCTLGNFIQ